MLHVLLRCREELVERMQGQKLVAAARFAPFVHHLGGTTHVTLKGKSDCVGCVMQWREG